ncbi:MAG: hypothetical protein JWN11_2752 [Hyphomicrobiales bacterium]|nr:hypothetical protein [Hyphomicrobiales bacterium]
MHEQKRPPAKAASQVPYQAHIDGLRAIAVLAVVADHIGLPGFQGGYVGVDIFFVISGYLIISQIVEGLRTRSFRFRDFWSRRALRILPPLLLVILVSVGIGSVVSVTSGQFHELGQEALSAALMVINQLLLSQQGYFDVASQAKPFLHLWSLAVEEQFYLVAPLILVGLAFLANRWGKLATGLIALMFVASLLACIVLSQDGKGLAFYSMPTRAWEFIAGGSLGALLPLGRRLSRPTVELVGIAGIAMLLACIFVFKPTPLYPSYFAVLPVLGACLLILAGLLHPASFVARLLASRPMVAIGLVSYAWYLWHWPLIVFTRLYDFSRPALLPDTVAALVALALAVLTHFWLERPILAWRRLRRTGLNWWPAVAGVGITVLVGYGAADIGQRLAAAAPNAPKGVEQMGDAGACRIEAMQGPGACLALVGKRRLGLLLGDSHAMAAYEALAAHATASNSALATLTIPNCAPILGVTSFEIREEHADCTAGHKTGLAVIAGQNLPLKYAVLYARWNLYAGNEPLIDQHDRELLALSGAKEPAPDQRSLFIAQLRKTVLTLRQHGIDKILVVAPTPEFEEDANDCVLRANKMHLGSDATCSLPRAIVDQGRKPALDWLSAALAGIEGVRLIDPLPVFCDADRCSASDQMAPQYRDKNHLNRAAEERLLAHFSADFAWVASPAL